MNQSRRQPSSFANPYWSGPVSMHSGVGRRAFLSILGLSGVSSAVAAALPEGAARRVTSLLVNQGRLMLAQATCDQFVPHVNSDFKLVSSASVVKGKLVKATPLTQHARSGVEAREPFSLLFQFPDSPHLPQQIYSVEHAELGRLEMFMVPVGRDAGGLIMEAVFN